MTHRSAFKAEGYEWLWTGGDDAILRDSAGVIERWRRVPKGVEFDKDTMKRASFHAYVWVRRETELPLVGRLDLTPGQIVEIVEGRYKGAFGVIESVFTISGGSRYRVTVDKDTRKAFRPNQVKLYAGA